MQGLGLVSLDATVRSRRSSTATTPRCAPSFRPTTSGERLRVTMIEEGVHDQLQGSVAPFVRQFAAAAGQPQDATEPTVHQALFLSNGAPGPSVAGAVERHTGRPAGGAFRRLRRLPRSFT